MFLRVILASLMSTASPFQLAPAAPSRNRISIPPSLKVTTDIQCVNAGNEQEVRLRHHLFLGELQSEGDITGLKMWPTATQPMLKKLQTKVLPAIKRARKGENKDRPLRVLELGSGCGLLGIGVASFGEEVVLTDAAVNFEPFLDEEDSELSGGGDTLQWPRDNIELNRDVVGGRAMAQKLIWGDEKDMAEVERSGPYDLIIGSELLYNNGDSFPGLVATMRRFAGGGGVPVLLGYKVRHLGETQFFDCAKKFFVVQTERIGRKGDAIQLAVCHPRQ